MCLAPVLVPGDGTARPDVLVGCRHCWQCERDRVDDWVGRCIAESRTSSQTLAVTLTYGEDQPNAHVLVYSDFQKFMKRLRNAGHNVRYIVAGEYGSKRGRAHWHAILFFSDAGPQHVTHRPKLGEKVKGVFIDRGSKRDRFHWKHWAHGFVLVQRPDYGAFRYVLKYVLKDQGAEVRAGHFAMSKKPPIGSAFFEKLAASYVESGLSPQDPTYSFADQKTTLTNKRRMFRLKNRSLELFLQSYVSQWEGRYKRPYPLSELLMEQLEDPQALRELDADRMERQIERLQSTAATVHQDKRHDTTVYSLGAGWDVVVNQHGVFAEHEELGQWLVESAEALHRVLTDAGRSPGFASISTSYLREKGVRLPSRNATPNPSDWSKDQRYRRSEVARAFRSVARKTNDASTTGSKKARFAANPDLSLSATGRENLKASCLGATGAESD